GGPLHDLHAAAVEQDLHAARELLHHLVLALDQHRPVDARLAYLDAELLGPADLLEEVGGHDPRLGGDAAPVEARAAQLVPLDHRGLETELGGADGGDVAPGPGADDDQVEVADVGHGLARWGTRSKRVRAPGNRDRTPEL